MKRIYSGAKAVVVAAVIAAGMLAPSRAQAMDILLFSRMNLDDQAEYVSDLVEGAARMLRAQGHPDEAERVVALFKDRSPRGGVHQFAESLKNLQALNIRNADNPNSKAPVYDVESAMEMTLKQPGVTVRAKDLETINRHFTPFYPLH